MKNIKITQEEVLKGFKEEAFVRDDLHHNLVENGKVVLVDPENCVLIKLDKKTYWVTTEPVIKMFNKNCDYEISIKYEIHETSKYSKALYTFER